VNRTLAALAIAAAALTLTACKGDPGETHVEQLTSGTVTAHRTYPRQFNGRFTTIHEITIRKGFRTRQIQVKTATYNACPEKTKYPACAH
jgi:hypothetical protein